MAQGPVKRRQPLTEEQRRRRRAAARARGRRARWLAGMMFAAGCALIVGLVLFLPNGLVSLLQRRGTRVP